MNLSSEKILQWKVYTDVRLPKAFQFKDGFWVTVVYNCQLKRGAVALFARRRL